MTVAELIRILEGKDPDAEVRIMMQESWPFECELAGVAVREEFASDECDCGADEGDEHADDCPAGGDGSYADGLKGNDVFLLEGRQERCGDKRAWEVADRW